MTLTQKHRSSIYTTLSPILGEEEAEALLGEFPASEGDELVTKDFLRAELAEQSNRLILWLVGVVLASMAANAAIAAALAG
ncbi:MAG: hypothetical protein M3Z03_06810 [Actinomycetota bacterium]|nr:hypothetical protein [Actinomycetota bacterium]